MIADLAGSRTEPPRRPPARPRDRALAAQVTDCEVVWFHPDKANDPYAVAGFLQEMRQAGRELVDYQAVTVGPYLAIVLWYAGRP